jgi:hypothetical protein
MLMSRVKRLEEITQEVQELMREVQELLLEGEREENSQSSVEGPSADGAGTAYGSEESGGDNCDWSSLGRQGKAAYAGTKEPKRRRKGEVRVGDRVQIYARGRYCGRLGKITGKRGQMFWWIQLEDVEVSVGSTIYKMRTSCGVVEEV